MPSRIKVDEIAGSSGNTITIPSGQTLDASSGTLTLPASALSSLNASNLSSGTVPNARLSGITRDKLDLISTASDASIVAKGTAGVTDGYIQLNCEQNSHGIKIKSPTHASGANYTMVMPPSLGTASQVLRMNSGATALEFGTISGSVFGTALLHVRDERASGTGYTRTSGSFEKVTLNTTKTNEISGASISSDVITLPSGTYFLWGWASITNAQGAVALRFRNTSDSSDAVLGGTLYMGSNSFSLHHEICGRFTIAAQKNFELQQRSPTTANSYAHSFQTEVWNDVLIWKIS